MGPGMTDHRLRHSCTKSSESQVPPRYHALGPSLSMPVPVWHLDTCSTIIKVAPTAEPLHAAWLRRGRASEQTWRPTLDLQ